jgi:hypothetical protein
MLVKKLALTGAYFSESGLFNELRQIQIRKNLPVSELASRLCHSVSNNPAPARRSAEQEIDSDYKNMYSEAFGFCQENSLFDTCLLSRTRAPGLDRKRPPGSGGGVKDFLRGSLTKPNSMLHFSRSPDRTGEA